MDFNRLNRGEQVAGIAGILLFLIMFIFDWYGPKGATNLGGTNAWESYSFIDIILFITAVSGVALALVAASDAEVGLPVALSAITTGLGALSVVLVVIRIISTPDYDLPLGAGSVETSIKIGVILGLIAAAGVAAGGWMAMQEEGTSFSGQADRFGGPDDTGGAAPPSPPPPPSSGP